MGGNSVLPLTPRYHVVIINGKFISKFIIVRINSAATILASASLAGGCSLMIAKISEILIHEKNIDHLFQSQHVEKTSLYNHSELTHSHRHLSQDSNLSLSNYKMMYVNVHVLQLRI